MYDIQATVHSGPDPALVGVALISLQFCVFNSTALEQKKQTKTLFVLNFDISNKFAK